MIKFTSVSKYFPPDSYAVNDISFEIEAGELVLLTGPSGSGKTTIMRLLTREHKATSGDIFFADKNNEIKQSHIHEHKRKIGVVFQDYKLLPELNIWENIALPLSIIGKKQDEIERRVTDLLTLIALTDKAYLFPQQLSGGEAQRISIARALSTGPAIVFADEPTGNLDKETSLEIGKLFQKINSFGTTIILATHDHDILELLKGVRQIDLEKGKIKKDTRPKKEIKLEVNSKADTKTYSPNETKEKSNSESVNELKKDVTDKKKAKTKLKETKETKSKEMDKKTKTK